MVGGEVRSGRVTVVVVSVLFGGGGATQSYDFACLPELRGGVLCQWRRTLSVAVAEQKGKLAQMMRKCNDYRG